MTTSDNPPFNMNQAATAGFEIFEVKFDLWGTFNAVVPSQAYENFSYPQPQAPGLDVAVSAIAIGPESTVDRAWVTLSFQRPMHGSGPYESITDRARRLSVGSPLYFSTSGTPNVVLNPDQTQPSDPKDATARGLCYVFPAAQAIIPGPIPYSFSIIAGTGPQDTTALPQNYFDHVGNELPFGTNESTPNFLGTEVSVFVAPVLHLYLYLKEPIVPLPASRAPLQITSGNFVMGTGEDTAEHCIGQIPIFGRARVRISILATDAGSGATPSAFRASVIRGINQDPTSCWEVDQATITIPAIGTGEIVLDHPEGDYLILYGQIAEGTPLQINYVVTAYDD